MQMVAKGIAMHGLINRALQCFVRDTYGHDTWLQVVQEAGAESAEFEAMLFYDDQQTVNLLRALAVQLQRQEPEVLEDVGTYLVSHPNTEALRRLMRFGGVTFFEFLDSLDELPARARLAVSDLSLPQLALNQHGGDRFSLLVTGKHEGWGHVMIGVLRAMADDYGALVFMEFQGRQNGSEVIGISLLESAFSEGRSFELGARA